MVTGMAAWDGGKAGPRWPPSQGLRGGSSGGAKFGGGTGVMDAAACRAGAGVAVGSAGWVRSGTCVDGQPDGTSGGEPDGGLGTSGGEDVGDVGQAG
jgi:hypothetical protein